MCPPDLKRSVFKYNELPKIFVRIKQKYQHLSPWAISRYLTWLSIRKNAAFFINFPTYKSSQLLSHLPVNNNKNASDYDPPRYKPFDLL